METLKLNSVIIYMFLFIGVMSSFTAADFPDDPKPCKFGDSDCIAKVMNSYLHNNFKGDSSVNLQSLDPLKIAKVQIKQGADSPVNIDLLITNNDLIGTSNGEITKVKGFGKDLTEKHEFHIQYKNLYLLGDYTINGRILVLPISGSGKSNLTLIDAEAGFYFSGTPVEKDGETYMNVKNLRLTLNPKRVMYNFGNLFNGDKELGDNMNLFLNENWSEIYNEAKLSTEKSFGKVYQKIINDVFQKYPYNKYFVE